MKVTSGCEDQPQRESWWTLCSVRGVLWPRTKRELYFLDSLPLFTVKISWQALHGPW